MLVKLVKDIVQNQTATCGRVDMILSSSDYAKLNVAICLNIKPTIAHFHPTAGSTSRPLIRRPTGTRSSAWGRTRWRCSRRASTT